MKARELIGENTIVIAAQNSASIGLFKSCGFKIIERKGDKIRMKRTS